MKSRLHCEGCVTVRKYFIIEKITILSSFEGHPLQVRHKQDWGRGFILLLPVMIY